MTAPTVVITSHLPGPALDILQDFNVRIPPSPPAGEEDLLNLLRGADGAITLLSDPVTDSVLAECPNLRIVANYAVGFDNIDVEAARRRGIIVTNTPGALTNATADLTMALILAVTRRVLEGHQLVVTGGFTGWAPSLLLGASISGKRLGIVGMGRIGNEVARRAEVFGMDVVYSSRSGAKTGAPGELVTIDELTRTSDIITIHCPLTEQTRGLFGRARLRAMKRGAYLINTARGPIVNEAELADALIEGHLAGAGLDVFENEPAIHPQLRRLRNAVLLPHLGSATLETRSAMAAIVATDVARVLNGKPPLHPV
ncbi:MAG: D-glycerate dehydrogenase [Acidobacteria bacterium]|nr:D-glycerate dehydrogenase [Acidobacteriota bacterium]